MGTIPLYLAGPWVPAPPSAGFSHILLARKPRSAEPKAPLRLAGVGEGRDFPNGLWGLNLNAPASVPQA